MTTAEFVQSAVDLTQAGLSDGTLIEMASDLTGRLSLNGKAKRGLLSHVVPNRLLTAAQFTEEFMSILNRVGSDDDRAAGIWILVQQYYVTRDGGDADDAPEDFEFGE